MNQIDKEIALKPCPFCGGEHIKIREFTDSQGRAKLPTVYWYACTKCYARTESGHSQEEAAKSWNTRPALSMPSGEVVELSLGELSALADYHYSCEAEADAMDYSESAKYHEERARYLISLTTDTLPAKALTSHTQGSSQGILENSELVKEIENKLIDALCEYPKDGESAIKLKNLIVEYKQALSNSKGKLDSSKGKISKE